MQVGDLVKHSGMNDVTWYGVITKKLSGSMVKVVWTFGVEGWFYPHDLEAVCK